MEQKFRNGDIVVLKSSPTTEMTIERQNTDGTYRCTWTEAGSPKTEDFHQDLLTRIMPPQVA